MYQSIPSLTSNWANPSGNLFDERILHPLGKKDFKLPPPKPIKTSQNPTPGGIFLNDSLQKHEKMRQKSFKTTSLDD